MRMNGFKSDGKINEVFEWFKLVGKVIMKLQVNKNNNLIHESEEKYNG